MRLSEQKWNSRVIPDRVKQRAAEKWELDGDCWISSYSVGSHGYAQVGWSDGGKNSTVLAHRAVWELHIGPVPMGFTLDHQCKTKKCVNPAHMRILPNFENARRTSGRDWPLGQCVNGHPNSDLYRRESGKTLCRKCNRMWQTKYEAKRKLGVS